MTEQWQPSAVGHVAADGPTVRQLAQVVFRSLPEYEPLLEPTPPVELPGIPSSADFPHLPKGEAFQLALHLDWAREHRIEEPELRIKPADVQVTRWLLTAVVEVLDRRRPLVQLQHQLDSRVFAAMETRLREPPGYSASTPPALSAFLPADQRVIEACGVMEHGQGARALVARLEPGRRGCYAACYGCCIAVTPRAIGKSPYGLEVQTDLLLLTGAWSPGTSSIVNRYPEDTRD